MGILEDLKVKKLQVEDLDEDISERSIKKKTELSEKVSKSKVIGF